MKEQVVGLPVTSTLYRSNAEMMKQKKKDTEREKEGIKKMNWVPNSPDFNPIERVWYIIKPLILTRRGSERITTATRMKEALQEEWDRITIDEINDLISRLPTVMQRCINVQGGNNFHG